MSIDNALPADLFKATFRHHAGGVVVITLDAGAGPVGFTATSLTSVSMEPPLVSFAVGRTSSSWPSLHEAATIVVNFLRHDQHEIATTFATSNIDRFAPPLAWGRLDSGEPVLAEARRWLRCEIHRRVPAGDHELIIAEITEIGGPENPTDSALVYHGGAFHPVGHV